MGSKMLAGARRRHAAPVRCAPGASQEPSRSQHGAFGPREAELRRERLPVKLQRQPVKVLTLLAQNGGRTVTREELKAEVWGDSTFVDFDRGLNFCVLQIRTALGDDADNPRFVQTVP